MPSQAQRRAAKKGREHGSSTCRNSNSAVGKFDDTDPIMLDSVLEELRRGTTNVTDLSYKANQGDLSAVKRLVASGVWINSRSAAGTYPINEAAVGGHVAIVNYLLDQRASADAVCNHPQKVFALGQAAAQGHERVVEALLLGRADANKGDIFGNTAVNPACIRGHDKCLMVLLKYKADPEGVTLGSDGVPGLMCSAVHGRPKTARILLEARANIDSQSHDGSTALHMAALSRDRAAVDRGISRKEESLQGRVEVWSMLVAAGASVNAQDSCGKSPIHYAKSDPKFWSCLNKTSQPCKVVSSSVDEASMHGDPDLKLAESSKELPPVVGPWRSLSNLLASGDLLNVVMLGESLDSAFLSHTIPRILREEIRATVSGGRPGAGALHIAELIFQAASELQMAKPTAHPMELHEPHVLIKQCDALLSDAASMDLKERVVCLFLRATVWRSMHDWVAAAADFRSAYTCSKGTAPWILRATAWCTASSTEGLPMRQVLKKYTEAIEIYDKYLSFLSPLEGEDSAPRDLLIEFTFTNWELAQVLLWKSLYTLPAARPSLYAFFESQQLDCSKVPTACENEAAALEGNSKFSMSLAKRTEDRLEKMGWAGIMNCYAKDSVLDHFAMRDKSSSQQPEAANASHAVETSEEHTASNSFWGTVLQAFGLSEQSRTSYLAMKEQEVCRMSKRAEARQGTSFKSLLPLWQEEQRRIMTEQEVGLRERRAAIDRCSDELKEKEKRLLQREKYLAQRKLDWEKKAADLKGQKEELQHLVETERLQHRKDIALEMDRCRKERDLQIQSLHQELEDANRLYRDNVKLLTEEKHSLESTLNEIVNTTCQDQDWRMELEHRKDLLAVDEANLSARQQQVAELHAKLEGEAARLNRKREQLAQEHKAQKYLHSGQALFTSHASSSPREDRVYLHDIRFSQNNIGSCFQDGRPLQKMVSQLRNGELQLQDIPQLRVVEYMDIVWSLDNRRLRCMKDAFPEERNRDLKIRVTIESLSCAPVQKEFSRKFTTGKTVEKRRAGFKQ